jgi:hypothetical protein
MSDPQDLGLGELGQRVQALGDPVVEQRLRPYHSGSQPATESNGHSSPSYGAHDSGTRDSSARVSPYESFEEFRVTPVHSTSQQPASPAPSPAPSPYASQFAGAPPYASSSQAPSQPAETRSAPASSGWDRPFTPPSAASAPATPGPAGSPPYNQPFSQPAQPASAAASASPEDPDLPKSGLLRAINAVRSALPLVQKLLPLIDGNVATAIHSLVTSQPQQQRTPAPPPPVVIDLDPIERGLTEVKNSHRELRNQVQEHVATMKRVEDQLEHVREATDRNTLEQQELVEDLRSVGGRLNLFAILGLVLLAVSVGLNIYFLIQLQHILR